MALLEKIVVGILSAIVIAILKMLYDYRDYVKPNLLCATIYRDKLVRISLATILEIRDDDDNYLLIKLQRRPEWFGPLGGVIKYYPTAQLEEKYEFKRHSSHGHLGDDLRGFLPGRHFVEFMKWFRSQRDRENDSVTRELIEELEDIGLVDIAKTIQSPPISLVRQIQEGIQRVPSKEDFHQFRYIEVYRLNRHNEKGRKLAESLFEASKHNEQLISVTADEIMRRRAKTGEAIGVHSGYLIGRKRTGPEPPPFYD